MTVADKQNRLGAHVEKERSAEPVKREQDLPPKLS
jgi:hypothetical protein